MKTVDVEAYRQGMRQLAAGVTIVTTRHEGRRSGLTATAVCSLTVSPPTLLACVNRLSSAHEPIRLSGLFCINVLAEEDAALARRFAGAESGEMRFSAGDWRLGASGLPVLATALASFECELSGHLPMGSHSIFLGRVANVVSRRGRPLLYADGNYGGLAALEEALSARS
jgi:flavin reductase